RGRAERRTLRSALWRRGAGPGPGREAGRRGRGRADGEVSEKLAAFGGFPARELATWDGGLAPLIVRTHRERPESRTAGRALRVCQRDIQVVTGPLDAGKAAVLRAGGAHRTCRETPAKSRTQWSPGPQMALPLLASSLLSDLDPAVTVEPGPKALLETQMPVEVTAAPGLTGPWSCPLENRPEPKRSPLKAAAGKPSN
ncbi:hypothetical protein MC885_014925, partial [Smutsia gigantea]